jgi:hypothetical protein
MIMKRKNCVTQLWLSRKGRGTGGGEEGEEEKEKEKEKEKEDKKRMMTRPKQEGRI